MLSGNFYPITGESLFSEEEENHEIYRENYGDPIYDTYADDVIHIDYVFPEDAFENLTRAKSGRNRIRAKFGFPAEIMKDQICASFVQIPVRANFGSKRICANFGSNQIRANFGSDPVRAKIGKNQEMEIKMDLRRFPMLKTLLKIRGRIFLGRRELMQRDTRFEDESFLGRRDLMQRRIRIIPI